MTEPSHRRRAATVTTVGLLVGTIFFAASLTPSLVPRPTLVQGALSGISLAAGYGVGMVLRWIWRSMQLPEPSGAARRWAVAVAAIACLGLAFAALWKASEWQNALRALMDMPPVETARPLTLAAVALVTFVLVMLIASLISLTGRVLSRHLARHLPGPQAVLLGVVATAALFWNIGNGVIARGVMQVLDASYQQYDALFEDSSPRPTDPLKTGSPASFLDWESLGRAGREMIAAGPDEAAIRQISGQPAQEPLRVYVGLNSAPDPQARAELALAELTRIGAFERGNLVIATPTGTGWVDPESHRALEYVLLGDVATVSVQYSYLASWIALLADPEYGAETARAVFAMIYGHWRELPRDSRPRLYLHGLSLGALNSDLSHDLFQVISDPYDGALWSGPPFNSRTWREVTRLRNPGTPAWLPTFRDGSVIRFTAQQNRLDEAEAPWGAYRLIYLQYASDAVVFFDPGALWRRPAWMEGARGPDVSPHFTWIPVVTFLQLGVDIMMAVVPPLGHGHTYAFPHYVDAWASLTDAPGWTDEGLERLKAAGAGME